MGSGGEGTRLGVTHYDAFELTDAVRPAAGSRIVLSEGYRRDSYWDPGSAVRRPMLVAAVSRHRLFEAFVDLLRPLGSVVDVVLESTHTRDAMGTIELCREEIDAPVLESTLWEYRDLLCDDGFTGIAVLNPRTQREVHFDEHKLLVVYGEEIEPLEDRLRQQEIGQDDRMKFVFESEHVHLSASHYPRQFDQLAIRLGMEGDFN